jgi:hypothetical protein|tara:strand:- start:179 stop:376 length:198 start_codon:yes stop_codon:yes gene_type:complete
VLLFAPLIDEYEDQPQLKITINQIWRMSMSKTIAKLRPVAEATVVSLVLVLAALAVPAVILYTAA